MTQYYARGSWFATPLIEGCAPSQEMHIAEEWSAAAKESACLAYIRDVVGTDEPLLGSAGSFVEQRKRKGQVMSRRELLRQFECGLMSYKATPLGGCTNPEPCRRDGKGLNLLGIPCLEAGCKHLIAKRSNIERVLRYQQALVDALAPDSVEYAMETRDLDVLRRAINPGQEDRDV